MVGTESVLVVAIVDGDLNADTGVDETNHGRRNTNVVSVTTIGSAGEPEKIC